MAILRRSDPSSPCTVLPLSAELESLRRQGKRRPLITRKASSSRTLPLYASLSNISKISDISIDMLEQYGSSDSHSQSTRALFSERCIPQRLFCVRGKSGTNSSASFSSSVGLTKIMVAVCLTITMIIAGSQVQKRKILIAALNAVEEANIDLEMKHDKLHRRLSEAQQKISNNDNRLTRVVGGLERDTQLLEKQLSEQTQQYTLSSNDISESHQHILNGNLVLEQTIKHISKNHAIEHFGNGPQYVEFVIQLPDEEDLSYFTVEMASLDEMSTSVNMFLEQVEKGLWDNTGFHMNPQHVIVAQPANDQTNKYDAFVNAGLADLPFPEYSDAYPHEAYTIGFNNKFGPTWYINKVDNTIPHGPMGLQNDGSPDSCFGKVIVGKHNIDRLANQPNRLDVSHFLQRPVEIVSARIVDLRDVHGVTPKLLKKKELAL